MGWPGLMARRAGRAGLGSTVGEAAGSVTAGCGGGVEAGVTVITVEGAAGSTDEICGIAAGEIGRRAIK